MPIIVGKESPSITVYYYKGNPFSQDFDISGDVPASSAVAKITRVSDPEKITLIQFISGSGLTISGQQIQLDKTSQEMILPPGRYEFIMEGVIGGVHMPFVQRSIFVINDAIGQQLPTPAYIVATAIGVDEIDVAWGASTGATGYILQRSLDALAWATIYTGPNAIFEDLGLTEDTLYYYRVWATGSGYADSGMIITNATTGVSVGGGGGGGASYPAGGNTGDYLVKASPADNDVEWVAFEEVPHDHDERYYTKDEIDAMGLGSGGVYTGTI